MDRRSLSPYLLLFLLLLSTLLTAGCQRNSAGGNGSEVTMELELVPDPPVVGEATLFITLSDAAGEPIEEASLAVKGDMSHAGMEPVLGEVEGGPGGVYEVPFEWTMGGDWFVTVDATLPNGETVSQRFDLTVAGAMEGMGK